MIGSWNIEFTSNHESYAMVYSLNDVLLTGTSFFKFYNVVYFLNTDVVCCCDKNILLFLIQNIQNKFKINPKNAKSTPMKSLIYFLPPEH